MTVKACKLLLSDVVERYRDPRTLLVDYEGVSQDPAFAKFEDLVCEIQAHSLAGDEHRAHERDNE